MIRTLPQTVLHTVNLEDKGRQGLISGFFPQLGSFSQSITRFRALSSSLGAQFELFCLQLRSFAYSSLRCLLNALSSNVSKTTPIISKQAPAVSKKNSKTQLHVKNLNCN